MKDLMKDRLINLANAQEFMADAADKMAKWDQSQLVMENSAFESLNLSDEVLNLSKNGSQMVGRLLECMQSMLENPCELEHEKVKVVLEELISSFGRIDGASVNLNEISHRIEAEAAIQREIEEGIKKTLNEVAESIDSATACVEFLMSEF
jgi:hypothetical protein